MRDRIYWEFIAREKGFKDAYEYKGHLFFNNLVRVLNKNRIKNLDGFKRFKKEYKNAYN